MTLHVPVTTFQTSMYSSLSGHPDPSQSTGTAHPKLVPIIPYKHTSKWKATVNKHNNPFTVNFETQQMPIGYGVSIAELTAYSISTVHKLVVRGPEVVGFPVELKKVQLRVVVSLPTGFIPSVDRASNRAHLTLQWPGYDKIDFCPTLDIEGGRITYGKLAAKVASIYMEFYDVGPRSRPHDPLLITPPALQRTERHKCTAEGWALTQEVFKTLRLLNIQNIYENVYQAEVIVG